ncbi:MAG: hypothetical protein PHE15_02795 [Dehalococcoidales bacterium]|nr:hypothetical protein [Dehalococcoidales bacterium]
MDEITSLMLAQIQEVEKKDEQQVLAEMAGETIKEYIYETAVYDHKTKSMVRKVRLSWVGTREVARMKGNIILSDPLITEVEDGLRIVIKATDLSKNFAVFGGTHQPFKMKIKDVNKATGEVIGEHYEDDPFVFQKGLSKAQRNALNACIPADFATKMIDRFLHISGGKQLTAPKRPQLPGKAPTKPEEQPRPRIKTPSDWDAITIVKDYPHLERIFWELTKLQPSEMYKQLGVTSKMELSINALDAFNQLKALYNPKDKPAESK